MNINDIKRVSIRRAPPKGCESVLVQLAQDLYCLTPVGGLGASVDVNTELSPPDRVIGPAVCEEGGNGLYGIVMPSPRLELYRGPGRSWFAVVGPSSHEYFSSAPPASIHLLHFVAGRMREGLLPPAYAGSSSRCRTSQRKPCTCTPGAGLGVYDNGYFKAPPEACR